ncbi:tyrosine-type recombinase/integrase [Flammeovirga agarivorans]|uniref:Site-specific integrase n=1 Tax=Flammeovirga agarivorans TaxID=2726742 RepID=A0A7X8SRD9_9BACT|nr:site-specific integrase [Flammeovirga agarivorans]NLR94956.1 site-specific integrase [Flammeovirga agarivorans]
MLEKKQDLSTAHVLGVKLVVQMYKKYIVSFDLTTADKNRLKKVNRNLTLFLNYCCKFHGGEVGHFDRYRSYLKHLHESNEISSGEVRLRKLVANNFNTHISGYLSFLRSRNITRVSNTKYYEKVYDDQFSAPFSAYLKSHSKLNRDTPSTANAVRVIKRYMNVSDGNINADAMLLWLDSLEIEPSTYNTYLQHLKSFARFCKYHNNYVEDADKILSIPRKEDSEDEIKRFAIEEAHLKKMYEVADFETHLILDLGSKMGLRAASMVSIRQKDIDFENNIIHIIAKGYNKRKKLPIPPQIKGILKAHCTAISSDKILPYSSNNLSQKFSKFLEENNLRNSTFDSRKTISLHNLRHTFAYNSIEKFGLRKTSLLLLHSSITTTEEHYLKHRSQDDLMNIYQED